MLTPEEIEIILLSLQVAVISVVVSLPFGIALGYWLARTKFVARSLVHAVSLLPLVMPPVVTGYLLLMLLGANGPIGQAWDALFGGRIAFTTGACVIAAAVVGFPFIVDSVRLSVEAVDYRLEQVSKSLGRGRVATFLRVTLPLALPGILAGAVLAFARALGEFGATIVLAGNIQGETRTVPLAVYTLLNQVGQEQAVVRLVVVSVAMSLVALIGAGAFRAWQRRRVGA